MSRLNDTRLKAKLLSIGYDGEQNLFNKLTQTLPNYIIIEILDESPYLPYDLLLKNTQNGKILKIEIETYTKDWNVDIFEMLDKAWHYGFNIPGRKILKLQNDNTPVLTNGEFVCKKQIDAFDLFIKLNNKHSKFLAIKFKTLVKNIGNKNFKIKKIKNKYDKVSNTNDFVILSKSNIQEQIDKKNILVDDFDKLSLWIINFLK